MKTKPYSIRKASQSITVMLYFVALVIHNLYHVTAIDLLWYLILITCFLLGTFRKKIIIYKHLVGLVLLFVLSGVLNILFVGNTSVFDIVFLVFFAGIYQLLVDDELDERFILAAIYLDCLLVAFTIIKTGLGKPIFGELSNNFVSVLLFLPTIVYYIRQEYYHKKISILPALAVTLTCFLAMGRAGIITSAVLLFFIVLYATFSDKNWDNARRLALFRVGVICTAFVLLGVFLLFLDKLLAITVFARFSRYGMYGTGRMGIWEEYISTMAKDVKSILLGVEYSQLPLMVRYRNNLHNSFLNMHADYGILVLFYIIYMFASNCFRCIRAGKWIYLSVMTVLFVRACTDKLFGGGAAATCILIFVLLHIRDKGLWKERLGKSR
ncbi:MAG: hypothetical protein K2P87_01040 [Lachnospiraceae bacterium]|nr:hypothetical protein [Lachnospiraceae bacterium]